MTGTRSLVTGGLGFIGSTLSARLAELGSRVTVVTPSRERYLDTAMGLESRGVRIVEGDIRDADTMVRVASGHELIFHVAGQSGAVRSMEDPWTDLDVNCRGSLVLLEALRASNREAKLVFVGSRLEYGRVPDTPVGEHREPDPLCIHAVHKLTVEKYLRLYARLFGIRYAIARVTNPYGPGQPRSRTAYGVVNRLIHLALSDETLTIYGDGTQRRDYIYIDDVVAALMALAVAPRADGRIYNVGTGVGTRLIDMAETITRIAGSGRVERVAWPPLARQIETGDFVADVSRIGRELGWRPSVTLEEGVRRTVAFSRAHVTL